MHLRSMFWLTSGGKSLDKIKKLILCHVPISACNLRCQYCYITLTKSWDAPHPKFRFSPEYIGNALSHERLGGPCFFNMCGSGETLIPSEMPVVIREILKQGHYIEIVTNGTLTARFTELATLPKELLERLSFKFSFHFSELERLGLMETFFQNIETMRGCGCSFTVELPPADNLIPRIEEIKKICRARLGALCQLTILRDDREADIPVLSSGHLEEYYREWESFDSDMLNYKRTIFGQHQGDFCYAGAWSFYFDLVTGDARKCYSFPKQVNLYEDLSASLDFPAVGHHCPLAHCYNGHALMTFGNIPGQTNVTYANIRNRTRADGTEWLNGKMKAFMSTKLEESNALYTKEEKKRADRESGGQMRKLRLKKAAARFLGPDIMKAIRPKRIQ